MTLQTLIAHYGLDQALAIISIPDSPIKRHMIMPPHLCPVCRRFPAREEYGVCNICRLQHRHDLIVEPRVNNKRFSVG